jgi:hypothetical protein
MRSEPVIQEGRRFSCCVFCSVLVFLASSSCSAQAPAPSLVWILLHVASILDGCGFCERGDVEWGSWLGAGCNHSTLDNQPPPLFSTPAPRGNASLHVWGAL